MFNLTAHELHEHDELDYYDIGLLLREALDSLRVRLNMYLVVIALCECKIVNINDRSWSQAVSNIA